MRVTIAFLMMAEVLLVRLTFPTAAMKGVLESISSVFVPALFCTFSVSIIVTSVLSASKEFVPVYPVPSGLI